MTNKKSEIWLHFSDEKDQKVNCKHCGQRMSVANKSTCSLIRHLNRRHPFHKIVRQEQLEIEVDTQGAATQIETPQAATHQNVPRASNTSQASVTKFIRKPLPVKKQQQTDEQMPAKRSIMWKHFTNMGEQRAMCKHCSAKISYNGGSVGNLSRHMKLKHSFSPGHLQIPDDEEEGKIPDEQVEQIEQALQSEQQSHENQPAKRSRVWKNFKDVGAKRAMCKHCSKHISYNGGSVGNLSRHMKVKHPFIIWRNLILNNENEGNIPDELDQIEQLKPPKVPPLKPKYEIIDGIIAPSSPIRSNNSSPALDADMGNLYEKQIEFVDGYLGQDPFVNEGNDQALPPRAPKIAKRENSHQNNQSLEDLKTRAEIQLMRAKTIYFRKQIDNLDIERSVMLLKVKKMELEVEKLNNEARASTWPMNSNDAEAGSAIQL